MLWLHRLWRLMASVDPHVTERWQAVYALVWGAWLLAPPSSFGLVPAWRILTLFAPEWVWGLASMAAGLLAFAATFNGPGLRSAANLWMVLGWLFIGISALLSFPPATAGVLFGALGARQMTLLWRSTTDWRDARWVIFKL